MVDWFWGRKSHISVNRFSVCFLESLELVKMVRGCSQSDVISSSTGFWRSQGFQHFAIQPSQGSDGYGCVGPSIPCGV